VAGARWVQNEVLKKYPKANLRVYAIWFEMFPGDSKATWSRSLLDDPRVVHRWDEGKTIGHWYSGQGPRMQSRLTPDSTDPSGDPLWDSYLLYGPDARWSTTPSGLILWGRTIMASRASLGAEAAKRFGTAGSK
jgi:hypothetical protein